VWARLEGAGAGSWATLATVMRTSISAIRWSALVIALAGLACGTSDRNEKADPAGAGAKGAGAASAGAGTGSGAATPSTAGSSASSGAGAGSPPSAPLRNQQCADFAACRAACTERRPAACIRMGDHSHGKRADEVEAAKTVKQLCDAGHAEACHALRFLAKNDERAAAKLLSRGCDLGYGPSCVILAASTKDRDKADQLRARGNGLLERTCQRGDPYACARIAHEARVPRAGEQADLPRARWYGDKACNLGDEDACYALAQQLGAEFPELAATLTDRACELGQPTACGDVGDRVSGGGKASAADMKRAADAWQMACDAGNDSTYQACGHLAEALTDGSLPADAPRADALRKRFKELASQFEGD